MFFVLASLVIYLHLSELSWSLVVKVVHVPVLCRPFGIWLTPLTPRGSSKRGRVQSAGSAPWVFSALPSSKWLSSGWDAPPEHLQLTVELKASPPGCFLGHHNYKVMVSISTGSAHALLSSPVSYKLQKAFQG